MNLKLRGKHHAFAEALRPEMEGEILERASMRGFTSFRIGGLCELMVFPKTEAELTLVVSRCQEQKKTWRVIGAGTNLLVRDGGVDEIIVNLSRTFNQIEWLEDHRVEAGAGLRLARLVKACNLEGLSGLEFAAGIPGTVGGAVSMNAGATGSEMAAVVEKLRGWSHLSGPLEWKKKQLKFSYRHFERPAELVITGVTMALEPKDPRQIRATILEGLWERRDRQPLHHPSAGSVFKNPPGHYAGQLIEAAGLRGFRLGDAQISDRHANFIVNRGRARSRDVITLIEKIQEAVEKKSAVKLELEIQIIGKE